MPTYDVYADTAVVVKMRIQAKSSEEALAKGNLKFAAMSDEEILGQGTIGAPLDGAFRVDDSRGETLLEES